MPIEHAAESEAMQVVAKMIRSIQAECETQLLSSHENCESPYLESITFIADDLKTLQYALENAGFLDSGSRL